MGSFCPQMGAEAKLTIEGAKEPDFYDVPVKVKAKSSVSLIGLLSIMGVLAYFVLYLGFAPVGNANDKCLANCSVIAGGDHFERRSGIIYQNLKEIENDNEIPPANMYDEDDLDMDISERHGKQGKSAGLTYHCMTTIEGQVISIGGKFTEKKIFKMELRTWREYPELETMEEGRFEHGCGFSHTSNSTVVCGGQSAKKEEVKVCEILTSDGKWNHYGELTIERRARPIVTEILTPFGARMYVIGGKDKSGQILSSTEVKLATGGFEPGAPLPTGLAMAASANLAGSTYIFGGQSANGLSADVYRFDVHVERFVTSGTMLKPRERHAVVPLTAHHAVIVGGRHNFDSEAVQMEIYDYRTGKTFKAGKIGPARPGISGAQITSEILI